MGPRLRRDGRPSRRPRVGRAGRDPVADHRGGRQDRSLLRRVLRQRLRRSDRPHVADHQRRDVLGRRRYRARHLRLHARRLGHRRQRHARAGHGVGAAVLRHAGEDPARCVRGERARRRERRQLTSHPCRLRRGEGRVGAQRHQDVDHERRHRRRARDRRDRSSPSSADAGTRASSCRPERPV